MKLASEMTPAELESPGLAFARQEQMEAAVTSVFDRVLRRFLSEALALAKREGAGLGAGALYAAWDEAIALEFDRSSVPAVALGYAAEALQFSDVPAAVFGSIQTVFAAAALEAWPDATRNDQLRLALRPDQGEAELALVAAARPRHGAAWDQLDQGGMKFMDRMKRDARTAVTGLDGILTSTALGEKGFTRKRWVTMHDAKVRETHADADGQTVALGEPFYVGGYPLMYPGERGAPPALVINCRCVLVGTRWRATDNTGFR